MHGYSIAAQLDNRKCTVNTAGCTGDTGCKVQLRCQQQHERLWCYFVCTLQLLCCSNCNDDDAIYCVHQQLLSILLLPAALFHTRRVTFRHTWSSYQPRWAASKAEAAAAMTAAAAAVADGGPQTACSPVRSLQCTRESTSCMRARFTSQYWARCLMCQVHHSFTVSQQQQNGINSSSRCGALPIGRSVNAVLVHVSWNEHHQLPAVVLSCFGFEHDHAQSFICPSMWCYSMNYGFPKGFPLS